MIRWSGIPFLRFALAFTSGIVFYILYNPSFNLLIPLVCSLLLYLLSFSIQKIRKDLFHALKPGIGFTALLTLFFTGSFFTHFNNEVIDKNHILNIESPITSYEVMIDGIPEERPKTFKVEAKILTINSNHQWKKAEGNVILYFPKEKYISIDYGDKLLIPGNPELVEPPSNPGEFDYKKHLHYKHIHHIDYINNNFYFKIDKAQGNSIIAFAYWLRKYSHQIIETYIPGETEQGIASALLLGLKGTMDNEAKQIYSDTGTTHVLAVSGMHVAIVFQILLMTLHFIKNSHTNRFVIPFILLAALWLYVMITGFSPSVLRAGVMFTIILFARILARNTNIYNSLFLSALILLCYDPYLIMDAGFQLSYLALIGIVYFSDKIYSQKEFDSFITDKIWMMISVTLAAQITTLPITILYFHQIPLSFLITNLFAIPISNIILIAGFVLLITSFIPYAGLLIGYFMKGLIWLMNTGLYLINELPFSVMKGLNFTWVETILLYLIIFYLCIFWNTKKFSYWLTSCTLGFALAGFFIFQEIETMQQKKIIAYLVKGHEAIGFIKGNNAIVYTDTLLAKDPDKITRHILPYLQQQGVDEYKLNPLENKLICNRTNEMDLYSFCGKTILMVNEKNIEFEDLPSTDYSFINSKNKFRKELPNKIYNVAEKGALVVEF